MTADYLSSGLSTRFVTAVGEGHWVMFSAGATQLLLAACVSLISEAMNVKATAYCKTEVSDHQPCNSVWVVNLRVVRAVEVCLVGCFSMVIAIMIINHRRVSGVFTDASEIATMADLLAHPPLIQQLRDLPPEAKPDDIERELAASRYMLGTFEANGQQTYGMIRLADAHVEHCVSLPWYKITFQRFKAWIISMGELCPENLEMPRCLPDALCLLFIASLFSIILAYWCVLSGPFNDWMNGRRLGASMVLSIHAVAIAYLVIRKEQILRLSHPYKLMARTPSKPAAHTLMARTRGTQFTSIYYSFAKKDISLASMSSAAVLCAVSLVMLPGVPNTPAQTREVYVASTWTCLVLLSVIFAAQTRVMYKDWRRSRVEVYDHCPDTLAAVLIRLCASRFVEEDNMQLSGSTGKELGSSSASRPGNNEDQNQRQRYEGADGEKRYIFGLMSGLDGVKRYMVDVDTSPR